MFARNLSRNKMIFLLLLGLSMFMTACGIDGEDKGTTHTKQGSGVEPSPKKKQKAETAQPEEQASKQSSSAKEFDVSKRHVPQQEKNMASEASTEKNASSANSSPIQPVYTESQCGPKGLCNGKICIEGRCLPCRQDGQCPQKDGQQQLCIAGVCKKGNCRNNAECKSGQLCLQNTCSPCTKDAQCGNHQICEKGACRAGCRDKAQCSADQVCDQKTLTCRGCTDDSHCTNGQICQNGTCTGCSADGDCESGKLCINQRCKAGECRSNNECPGGQVCEHHTCSNCTKDSSCDKGELCIAGSCRKGNCRNNGECGKPSCRQLGTMCEEKIPFCSGFACQQRTQHKKHAVCNPVQGRCQSAEHTCTGSQAGVGLSYAAYAKAHELNKYIPGGFKLVKSWRSNKYTNGDHVYLTLAQVNGMEVCHYNFRGLEGVLNALSFLAKLAKTTNCYTKEGKSMGTCIQQGFQRYLTLRNYVRNDLAMRLKQGGCAGGLRFNGHSMGGVMASMMAAELWTFNPKFFNKMYMRVYTFGSPRIFKNADANKWNQRLWIARWVYEGLGSAADPAPSYPRTAHGFSHFGQAFTMNRNVKSYIPLRYHYQYGRKSQNWAPISTTLLEHGIKYYSKGIAGCRL